MLCELHCIGIHGKTIDSDPNIDTHYIVYDRFDSITGQSFNNLENDEYDDEYDDDNGDTDLNNECNFMKNHYLSLYRFTRISHPVIKNYRYIISQPNYIKPEIGEYIILPTQEAIAILKTFWLRIIQRKWKKIILERKRIINMRKSPIALFTREITGNWPSTCRHLPLLRGMLKELKKG